MQIRRFDPVRASDAELGAVYQIYRSCAAAAETIRTHDEWLAFLRSPPAAFPRGCWLADADRPIGFGMVIMDMAGTTGYAKHLLVDPEHRRRGVGRALLGAVTERVRGTGRQLLHGDVHDEAGRGFAAALGARTGNTNRSSRLRLPARLPAPTPVSGYRLLSWIDAAPDDLIDSYAVARYAINDAPHDGAVTPTRYTAETVRDLEATVTRRGQQTRVTVAIDATGTVAGYTEMRLSAERGTAARTDDTAVVAAHRRQGLARWIKLESLRLLAAERPDVSAVVTENDVTNTPMLAVNTSLGFEPTVERTDAILTLS